MGSRSSRVRDASLTQARERMLVAAVLAAVAGSGLPAQGPLPQFAEMLKQHLPADRDDSRTVAVGDVDADGDLDLVVGNYGQQNRLYLNDGDGRFTDATAARMPVDDDWTKALALGDVDGDGDLDVVVGNGRYLDWQNRLYLNDGTGRFTDATAAKLPLDYDVTQSLALGDLDGDGDLDLVVGNGRSLYGLQNRLYLNDGTGRFQDATAAGLPVARDPTWSIGLGDVDGDGDLDLVVGNLDQQNRLYLNDGTARFTDATASRMPVASDATTSVVLGDLDGDGDVDLVAGNHGQQNRLYLNDGRGRFTDATVIGMPTDSAWTRSLALGDVDGDGDPDLVVGNDGQNRLYLCSSGRFTDATASGMPAGDDYTASVTLGDVDLDGDLDLVVGNGRSPSGQQNRLCSNDGTGRFTDASAARIPVDQDGTSSLALADVDGDGDLDLVVGNDHGEQNRLYLNDGTGRFTDATAAQMPVDRDWTRALALGDVDADGDLDLVVGNTGLQVRQNRLYLNDGTGRFTDATAARMPVDDESTTSLALGDVDGDGDLDLVVGNTRLPGQQIRLYLNAGAGTFTDATAARLPPANDETTSLALGDVDGDGDLDLVVGNTGLHGQQNRLYLNGGAGTFMDVTAARLPPASHQTTSLALGDVDGDGDLDLLVGNSGTNVLLTPAQNRLYLNDGSGRFIDATAARMPVDNERTTSLALGDVDGDGDPDLVVGNGPQQNRLHLNDGSGRFTDVTAARMPMLSDPTTSIALGDVDGDGDRDVVVGNIGPDRLDLNLLHQLDAPYLLRLGDPWQLDVYARFGPPRLIDVALPFLSFAPASAPLPPLGTVGIDPALAVPLPPFVVLQPPGVGSVSVQIPYAPNLVGVRLYAQALLIQHPVQIGLTGVVAESIVAR